MVLVRISLMPNDVGHLFTCLFVCVCVCVYVCVCVHMCVCVCVYIYAVLCLVAQSYLFVTLWTVARQAPLSMGILQARILEWVAMLSSRGSSQPRD